jgi:hypothetical protein
MARSVNQQLRYLKVTASARPAPRQRPWSCSQIATVDKAATLAAIAFTEVKERCHETQFLRT